MGDGLASPSSGLDTVLTARLVSAVCAQTFVREFPERSAMHGWPSHSRSDCNCGWTRLGCTPARVVWLHDLDDAEGWWFFPTSLFPRVHANGGGKRHAANTAERQMALVMTPRTSGGGCAERGTSWHGWLRVGSVDRPATGQLHGFLPALCFFSSSTGTAPLSTT